MVLLRLCLICYSLATFFLAFGMYCPLLLRAMVRGVLVNELNAYATMASCVFLGLIYTYSSFK